MTVKEKLATFVSKKLIATILGSVLAPFLLAHGVPADTVSWIMGLIAVYVGGQAAVDAVSAHKGV